MTRAIKRFKRILGSRAPRISDVLFEADGGWWIVSLPRVHGAHTQGKTRRSAYSNLLSLLVDLERARRDGLIT